MGWPVDALYQVFASGTTVITDRFLGVIQSGVNGLYGGGLSISRLTVDGGGGGAPLAASGSIYAAGNIYATNCVASGSVTCYGNVLGNKLITDGGGTSLELRSGTQVYAYHATGVAQTSGGGSANALSVAVPSGRAALIVARGIGMKTNLLSGAVFETEVFSWANMGSGAGFLTQLDYTTSLVSQVGTLAAGVVRSGSTAGGIQTTSTSGTAIVQAVGGGTGAGVINWTVYADVTLSP